jgi:hypothetical protein
MQFNNSNNNNHSNNYNINDNNSNKINSAPPTTTNNNNFDNDEFYLPFDDELFSNNNSIHNTSLEINTRTISVIDNEQSFDWYESLFEQPVNIMNIEENMFEIDEEKSNNATFNDNITSITQNTTSANTSTLFNQVTTIDTSTFKTSFNPKNNYSFLSSNITKNLQQYMFTDDVYEPGLKISCTNNALCLIECDDSICRLNYSLCTNRKIQKAIHWNSTIVVETLNGMGKQLLCNLVSGIMINEIIGEYTGKVIKNSEAKYLRKISGQNIFLLELYANKNERKNLYLDPRGIYGNNTFYINHSCSPNTEFEVWNIEGIRRISVKTIKNIRFRDPITVDYNIIVDSTVNKNQLMKCKCGSEFCKDTVQKIGKEKTVKKTKKMKK